MFLSRLSVVFVVLAALSALAFKPGMTLVVISDTKLHKEARASSSVVAALARHETVIWLGAAPKSTTWQQVQTTSGKKGFVETTALTDQTPRPDVARDGGFAGTKADGGLDSEEAALLEVERLNR